MSLKKLFDIDLRLFPQIFFITKLSDRNIWEFQIFHFDDGNVLNFNIRFYFNTWQEDYEWKNFIVIIVLNTLKREELSSKDEKTFSDFHDSLLR